MPSRPIGSSADGPTTAILLTVDCQRQDSALVLQQHDGLPLGIARQLPVRCGIVLGVRNLGVRHALRRIEHAEPDARLEQPLGGTGDLGFRDGAGLDFVEQALVLAAAGQIRARLDGRHRRGALRRDVLVTPEDVADRAAIAHHVALEAPLFAQALLEEVGAGAAGHAVHRVVDAHDGTGLAFRDRRLERVQVGVDQVVLADLGVEGMAQRFRAAVHGVVLRRGDGLQVTRIVALHALDEGDAHAAGQIRIFAVGLLTAPPAGIPEDVDVRRPVIQVGDAAGSGAWRHFGHGRLAHRLVVLGARFGGDDVGHPVHQLGIEGGAEPDWLGKHGGAALGDAVQGLVPPVVDRHAETRNRGSAVLHLQHLLLQRHARDEIRRALLGCEIGIQERRASRWLGERGCSRQRGIRPHGASPRGASQDEREHQHETRSRSHVRVKPMGSLGVERQKPLKARSQAVSGLREAVAVYRRLPVLSYWFGAPGVGIARGYLRPAGVRPRQRSGKVMPVPDICTPAACARVAAATVMVVPPPGPPGPPGQRLARRRPPPTRGSRRCRS